MGPFYHRSRETDRLRREAVSWWFTKPEDLSFLFDPGSVLPVGEEAPGPKVDLDEASDEQLRNLAAIAEIVDDSEEAGAKPEPPLAEEPPVDAVDWATVGARLIAHAERVRERTRGGQDWMSRFAECERDEEHEEEEFPALKIPNKSEDEDGSEDDDDPEVERLQDLFDEHLRQCYPDMEGNFVDGYKKWSDRTEPRESWPAR